MAKIYFKKNQSIQKLKPKKETVTMILNYSKALSYFQCGTLKAEIIAN